MNVISEIGKEQL